MGYKSKNREGGKGSGGRKRKGVFKEREYDRRMTENGTVEEMGGYRGKKGKRISEGGKCCERREKDRERREEDP